MSLSGHDVTDDRIRRRIRAVIEARGLTVKQLSLVANADYRSMVSYLKDNDPSRFPATVVGKIAIALNISADWLLTGRGHIFDSKALSLGVHGILEWSKHRSEEDTSALAAEIFEAYYLSEFAYGAIPANRTMKVHDEAGSPSHPRPFTRIDVA